MADTKSLCIADSIADEAAKEALFYNDASTRAAIARLREWEAGTSHLSQATILALNSDWAAYVRWCYSESRPFLPVSTQQLSDFLMAAVQRGCKLTTIKRYIHTLRRVQQRAGLADPTRDNKWIAILSELKARIAAQTDSYGRPNDGNTSASSRPLCEKDIAKILSALGNDLRSLRDAALLCLAQDTLMKSQHLVQIKVSDISELPNGLGRVTVQRRPSLPHLNTTDERWITTQTLLRLRRWIEAAGIIEGYVFVAVHPRSGKLKSRGESPRLPLTPRAVACVFRDRASQAGVIGAEGITSHSSRIGAVYDLDRAGLNVFCIGQMGGWRVPSQVCQYLQAEHAGNKLDATKDWQKTGAAEVSADAVSRWFKARR